MGDQTNRMEAKIDQLKDKIDQLQASIDYVGQTLNQILTEEDTNDQEETEETEEEEETNVRTAVKERETTIKGGN